MGTHIRVWGVEGDRWVCKTVLAEGHQRTVRSGVYIHVASFPCIFLATPALFHISSLFPSVGVGKAECLSYQEENLSGVLVFQQALLVYYICNSH